MTPPAARPSGAPSEPCRGGAPEAVGQILGRVFKDARPAVRRRRSAVADAWHHVAGPDLDGETRPDTLHHGVLTVEVRSTALLAELQGFRRDELLARLVAATPQGRVTGLRFRPGVF